MIIARFGFQSMEVAELIRDKRKNAKDFVKRRNLDKEPLCKCPACIKTDKLQDVLMLIQNW